jgi:Phospholipase_D-nuclease N-terminal
VADKSAPVAQTSCVIKVDLFLGVIGFALTVYCLIEAISTPEGSIRNLPKVAWIFLILLFPVVGSVAWLVAGRPERSTPLTRMTGAAPGFPEYERPGRFAVTDETKDDEFLRKVRERAEQQRLRYEAEKKREEEQDPDDV